MPTRMMSRIALPAALALALAACGDRAPVALEDNAAVAATTVTALEVFKTPTCGCCGDWVTHMEGAGFAAAVTDLADLNPVKAQLGIQPQYQSCHTGVIDGFVFEGHVPAPVVARFLEERPAGAIGLAVPGMPIGSPGMEMGDRFTDYDVLLLMADGSAEVYQHVTRDSFPAQ